VVAVGGGAVGYYAFGGGAFGVHALGGNVQDPEAVKFFEPWKDLLTDPAFMAGVGIGVPICLVLLLLAVKGVVARQRGPARG
jgi:hypothetical protein